MADYIRTVPQESFNMAVFRSGLATSHECSSIGCVIGHCTVLDKNPLPIDNEVHLIDFDQWSINFTGLGMNDPEWHWCFGGAWCEIDNTPTGAADRIEWLLKHGLPEDWATQLEGDKPLIYRTNESK